METDPAETLECHSGHTRGPFIWRVTQQIDQLCALSGLCAQGVPLPEESGEPTECCSTGLQGCLVQRKCKDGGVLLCTHMGLSLLERVGSEQNSCGTCTQDCPVQRNHRDTRALLHTQVRLPIPRKVRSWRDFAKLTYLAAVQNEKGATVCGPCRSNIQLWAGRQGWRKGREGGACRGWRLRHAESGPAHTLLFLWII